MVSWFKPDSRAQLQEGLHWESTNYSSRGPGRGTCGPGGPVRGPLAIAGGGGFGSSTRPRLEDKLGHKQEIVGSEKLAVGLWPQQHQPDEIVAHKKGETELSLEVEQLQARLPLQQGFGLVFVDGVAGRAIWRVIAGNNLKAGESTCKSGAEGSAEAGGRERA